MVEICFNRIDRQFGQVYSMGPIGKILTNNAHQRFRLKADHFLLIFPIKHLSEPCFKTKEKTGAYNYVRVLEIIILGVTKLCCVPCCLCTASDTRMPNG